MHKDLKKSLILRIADNPVHNLEEPVGPQNRTAARTAAVAFATAEAPRLLPMSPQETLETKVGIVKNIVLSWPKQTCKATQCNMVDKDKYHEGSRIMDNV